MASNWPLHAADLRKALEYDVSQDDAAELELFMASACERIDTYTGRNNDAARHVLPSGKLPTIFVLAARYTAKLWWQQEHKGPRARPSGEDGETAPMGVDLPRKVQAWLAPYPPRLFIPAEEEA